MSGPLTILFLAADPFDDRSRLYLDREAREIERAIQRGRDRDALKFECAWALCTGDLQAALRRHRPQVVHFSGHAEGKAGIYLEDAAGRPRAVGREALAHLFEILQPSVRVVLLNACESLPTVEAFRGVVDYCIGMNSPISDAAAITFSGAFYGAVADGECVQKAFKFAVNQLELDTMPESNIPRLHVRNGAGDEPLWRDEEQDDEREEEAHYLRTLVSKLDTLAMYSGAAGQERGGAGQMRISEIFTQPELTLVRGEEQTVTQALNGAPAQGGGDRIRVRAVEAFGGVPRLVVLGDPGGGKSVLVSHVAVQLALRRLAGPETFLPGWNDDDTPLPVVVLLREMARWLSSPHGPGAGAPRAGWVWNYLEAVLEGWGCAGAVALVGEAIREGRAAVFFDGLDEVAETEAQPWRTRVVRALREFAAPLPGGRVFLTCRRYAYGPGDAWSLPRADFPVVELDRFHLGQIRSFAVQWYASLGRKEGWDPGESRRRALLLYEQIKGAVHLRDLAGSPLLLTLMARIHRAEQALPDDRAQLYDRAIDLLLAEWENRKDEEWRGEDPEMVVRLGVPINRLRASLAGLAFDAHAGAAGANGGADGTVPFREIDLLKCLRPVAGGLDAAEAFIEDIRTRAGLLVLRDDGTYAFPHRTFQEYLAAAHLLTRDDFAEALLQRLRDDFAWWREVFFLAAATLSGEPERLAALADAVLAEVEDAPDDAVLVQAAASVALPMAGGAFARAADGVRRYARLRARMRAVLGRAMRADQALAPRVRAEAGFALARIGDPREELRAAETMPFVPVQPGPFWMGTDADDPEGFAEEVPRGRAEVGYGYWIAQYPVTRAQFAAFARAAGRPAAAPDPSFADTLPAAVSWYDATAFCRWLTGCLREQAPDALQRETLCPAERALWTGLASGELAAALPNDLEWEKAARGEDGRRYPWGDAANANCANYQEAAIGGATVVGCFPSGASRVGAEEMAGGVWEWTRSLWGEKDRLPDFYYPYDPADGREDPDAPAIVRRVLRGGGYPSPARTIRCASRLGLPPETVSPNCGFRVVVVPTSVLPVGEGERAPGTEAKHEFQAPAAAGAS